MTISVIYLTLVLRFLDVAVIVSSDWAFLEVIICGPALLGLVLGINIQEELFLRLLSSFRIFPIHPSLTAWDRRFSRAEEQWVLVTLKNGSTIAGFYGKDSFAASTPDERDMYIQWMYDTDEERSSPSFQEKGVYVGVGEVSTIEFWPFDSKEEADGQE